MHSFTARSECMSVLVVVHIIFLAIYMVPINNMINNFFLVRLQLLIKWKIHSNKCSTYGDLPIACTFIQFLAHSENL